MGGRDRSIDRLKVTGARGNTRQESSRNLRKRSALGRSMETFFCFFYPSEPPRCILHHSALNRCVVFFFFFLKLTKSMKSSLLTFFFSFLNRVFEYDITVNLFAKMKMVSIRINYVTCMGVKCKVEKIQRPRRNDIRMLLAAALY